MTENHDALEFAELEEMLDEDLEQDAKDDDVEEVEYSSISVEDIDNTGLSEGSWVPIDLTIPLSRKKRAKISLELHLLPLSSPKVQNKIMELYDRFLKAKANKKYKQMVNRASGNTSVLPNYVKAEIHRRAFYEDSLLGWRGKDGNTEPIRGLPSDQSNAKRFVTEVFPHDFWKMWQASNDEGNFITLRESEAVENLPHGSGESTSTSTESRTTQPSESDSETTSSPKLSLSDTSSSR